MSRARTRYFIWSVLFVLACFGTLSPPLSAQPADFPGWPLEWKGLKLRRAPLTAADRVCVSGFSGVSARFVHQERSFLFRWTKRPTRTLTTARDCYERAGYHVVEDRSARPDEGWTCSVVAKTGERLRVCETVYSDGGLKWANADVWLTEAINDRLPGPYWSVLLSQDAH